MAHVSHIGDFKITTAPKGKKNIVKIGAVSVFQYNGVDSLYGVHGVTMGWGVGGYASTPELAIQQVARAFGFSIASAVAQ